MTDLAVEVRGLRKSYAGTERVHGIDFTVGRGEIFGLLGTNGAGKTSTIEILEGYRPRDGGEVSVLGLDPDRPTRAWRERVGIVLQESELDPLYTVLETVTQFARYYEHPGVPSDVIARVGLHAKADARIGSLSGGQKRAVDVALGLIGSPELLFLDEPTTGLDPAARREMWATVDRLREVGTTIVLTTHYMDEAQQLADRLLILRDGSVVGAGAPRDLVAATGEGAIVSFRLGPGVDLSTAPRFDSAPAVDDGVVRLHSSDPQHDLYRLLSWAEERDVALHALSVDRPTLDDVFLQLTAAEPTEPTEPTDD